MKLSLVRYALVIALALGVSAGLRPATQASAQDATSFSAVVLDLDAVFRNAVSVLSLRDKLREREESVLATLSDREENLFAENRDLQAQRDVLSEEVFTEQANDIQKRAQELNESADQYSGELERTLREGLEEVQTLALSLAEEIAAARGADVVLSKDTLFLLTTDLEITAEVLEKLNVALSVTQAEQKLAELPLP